MTSSTLEGFDSKTMSSSNRIRRKRHSYATRNLKNASEFINQSSIEKFANDFGVINRNRETRKNKVMSILDSMESLRNDQTQTNDLSYDDDFRQSTI